MKELKMFPQITEETEENLLNLEEEPKSPPYSTTPPLNPSCSSSESPPDAPSSPNHENQVPCPLPTITTEDVDCSVSPNHHQNPPALTTPPHPDEEFSTPPPRTRMRSLSGGPYRLTTPAPPTGRHRRQSGDDVLSRVSPSRKATLFDQFRPRSKSDSKGKRPTFLTTLKNSLLGGGSSVQRKTSLEADPPTLEHFQQPQRPRSGSETKGGTMSKMIDLFRSRSHSVSYDSKGKMIPPVLMSLSNDKVKRRLKKPYLNTYRSFDGHKGDSYGCHSEDETGDRFDLGTDPEKFIPNFFSSFRVYDTMPKSGKVIVLSTELLVKNAFSCLLTNEIHAAPLWDSSQERFIGLLTITDFVNVLRHYYYNSPEDITDIENQKIITWKNINGVVRPLIEVSPNDSLAKAARLLIEERVHRLPVYDETRNSMLFVVTRRGLLQYLYNNLLNNIVLSRIPNKPQFWDKTIGELQSQIGTWDFIATVSMNTRVIEALDLFDERRVSALPVVDENNRLLSIFAKFDVFALAKEQTYDNLDMTVKEALDKLQPFKVYISTLDDRFGKLINDFGNNKVHRFVAIDENRAVIGMISLSDILKFLVLQPHDDVASTSDTIDEAPEGAVGGQDDSSVLSSGKESSGKLQESSSLEKQDSSEISGDLEKLQLEGDATEPQPEASADERIP